MDPPVGAFRTYTHTRARARGRAHTHTHTFSAPLSHPLILLTIVHASQESQNRLRSLVDAHTPDKRNTVYCFVSHCFAFIHNQTLQSLLLMIMILFLMMVMMMIKGPGVPQVSTKAGYRVDDRISVSGRGHRSLSPRSLPSSGLFSRCKAIKACMYCCVYRCIQLYCHYPKRLHGMLLRCSDTTAKTKPPFLSRLLFCLLFSNLRPMLFYVVWSKDLWWEFYENKYIDSLNIALAVLALR
jgi:hypothetical protein